jgi:IPT/TIG domain
MYATGLRNAFDIVYTSTGEVFGTDNGPNTGFGDISTECTDDDANVAGPIAGSPSQSRGDKIYKVIKGGFYGHPNLNRQQCAWIDSTTHKDVLGRDPPANYVKQLAVLGSSVDGIIEYTASHFGSSLKGELIASSFAPNDGAKSYRLKPTGQPEVLDALWSDVAMAQGFYGEIIFPRVGTPNDIRVLKPSYVFPTGLSARVVTPFRGGKLGGLLVVVTGHGFGSSPTVTIDGKPCPVVPGSVGESPTSGSILQCATPPATAGKELVDVAVTNGGSTSVIVGGFLYSLSNV